MNARTTHFRWQAIVASILLAAGLASAQDGPLPIHPEKLKQLQKRIDAGERVQDLFPKLVEIQVEFYALPHVELTNLLGDITLLRDGDRLKQKLEALAKEKKAWLSASSLLSTKSGERTQLDTPLEWSVPADWTAPRPAFRIKEDGTKEPTVVPSFPEEFESQTFGLKLQADSYLGHDNDTMDWSLALNLAVKFGETSIGEGPSKASLPEIGSISLDAAGCGNAGKYQLAGVVGSPSLLTKKEGAVAPDLRVIILVKPAAPPLVPPGLKIPEFKPKEEELGGQVGILAEWIEVDVSEAAKFLEKPRPSSDASEFLKHCKTLVSESKARILDTAALTTKSNHHASLSFGTRIYESSDYDPPDIRPFHADYTPSKVPLSVIPIRPTEFEYHFAGASVNFNPQIGDDNFTVYFINAAPSRVEKVGEQIFGEDPAARIRHGLYKKQELSHGVIMHSGDCILAGCFHPAAEKPVPGISNSQKRILLFYRAIVHGKPKATEPEPQAKLPELVETQFEFITVPHADLAALLADLTLLRDGDRFREELRKLEKADKAWLSASAAAVGMPGRFSMSDCLDWRTPRDFDPASVVLQELQPGKVETIIAPISVMDTQERKVGLELEAVAEIDKEGQITMAASPQLTFVMGDAVFGEGKTRIALVEYVSLAVFSQMRLCPGRYGFLGILKSPEDLMVKPGNPKPGQDRRVVVMVKANRLPSAPRGAKLPTPMAVKDVALNNMHFIAEHFEVEAAEADEIMAKPRKQADATALLNQCRQLILEGKASRIEISALSARPGEGGKVHSYFEHSYPGEYREVLGGAAQFIRNADEKPPPPVSEQLHPHIAHPSIKLLGDSLGTSMEINPIVGNNGYTIDLDLNYGVSSWIGDQVFPEDPLNPVVRPINAFHQADAATSLLNGGCVLLRASTPHSKEGAPSSDRRILVFLRAIASAELAVPEVLESGPEDPFSGDSQHPRTE